MSSITALSPFTYLPIPPAALATADPQLSHNIKVVATQVLQTIFPSQLSGLSKLILDYLITPLPSHQDIYEQMRNSILSFRTVLAPCFQELLSSRKELTREECLKIQLVCLDLISDYLFFDIQDIYIKKTAMLDGFFCYVPKVLKLYALTPEEREKQTRLDMNDVLSRCMRELLHAIEAVVAEKARCVTGSFWPDGLEVNAMRQSIGQHILIKSGGGQIGSYQIGISASRGRKVNRKMEDFFLAKSLYLQIGDTKYQIPFFAVFDGHGGCAAAEDASIHFADRLLDALRMYNPEKLNPVGIYNASKMACVNWSDSFRSRSDVNPSGTTLLFAFEVIDMMVFGSTGNSRTVLYNRGMFIQLTEDAKPSIARFRQGIEHREGTVVDGAIQHKWAGRLNIARAGGDVYFGKWVSARPKITMLPTSFIDSNAIFVLVSDGFFEVVNTRELLEAIEKHRTESVDNLAYALVALAYKGGSKDNLTALVVKRH